jgi:hypothetical protein
MMQKATTNLESVLERFIPKEALTLACKKLRETPCNIQITESRNSVHGDFRVDHATKRHTITVNGDLNRYMFLITLMHEVAHLNTWIQYRDKVRPHGDEWKNEFKKTLGPFVTIGVFPPDIQAAVIKYLANPAAATCSDPGLMRVLAKYDRKRPGEALLEEIPERTHFVYNGTRTFVKGKKVRTRYECRCTQTNHIYLFHPLSKVSKP